VVEPGGGIGVGRQVAQRERVLGRLVRALARRVWSRDCLDDPGRDVVAERRLRDPRRERPGRRAGSPTIARVRASMKRVAVKKIRRPSLWRRAGVTSPKIR
jgi:hypothetical protein